MSGYLTGFDLFGAFGGAFLFVRCFALVKEFF